MYIRENWEPADNCYQFQLILLEWHSMMFKLVIISLENSSFPKLDYR